MLGKQKVIQTWKKVVQKIVDQRGKVMTAVDYACGVTRYLVIFPAHATFIFDGELLKLGRDK